ncbi:FAD-binding domain-containing protein [Rhizodiscina lignyota]|uniref:FAD-binding domain-containing protein n=1 Tax=Rhizodiscina lignyota TaxID=1504668 RepID=A0A9P4M4Z4_9PEZI|nr:FAD-binding domain-containing protein [Rhizodiscina lignyota]
MGSLFFYLLCLLPFVLCKNAQRPNDNWQQLNQTVGGRLFRGTPLALPCFSFYEGHPHDRDPASCAALQKNYTDADIRIDLYAGFMNSQDEICASNASNQCLLDSMNPLDPLAYTDVSCNQGSVSPYYVAIKTAEDIRAAFEFSRRTGTRLSIKATGHDYLTRNSLKGSLALWMRWLQDISLTDAFVPDSCGHTYKQATVAMTVGAGVTMGEAYTFADKHKVTYIGGYGSTIGVSGGFTQGGGHSVLSPVYGLGVDRVLQYKIVTPDGVLRTTNECQNPDLFWALRGGGGGTFGVVIESTHKVEPVIPLAVASMSYPIAPDMSNVLPFLNMCVNNSLRWAKEGWGGHIQFMTTNLIHVNPLLSLEEAEKSMGPATEFVKSQNGTVVIEMLPSWNAFYQKYVVPNTASVGQGLIIAARFMPASLFETTEGRAKLMDFLGEIVAQGALPYIPMDTPYYLSSREGKSFGNDTSITPSWRNSIWELSWPGVWPWNSTVEEKQKAIASQNSLMEKAKELAPDSGAYMNEAFPWTVDWQQDWWGESSYMRLLEIKKRYDPDGLLSCWKCIGFKVSDSKEKFPCFGKSDEAGN